MFALAVVSGLPLWAESVYMCVHLCPYMCFCTRTCTVRVYICWACVAVLGCVTALFLGAFRVFEKLHLCLWSCVPRCLCQYTMIRSLHSWEAHCTLDLLLNCSNLWQRCGWQSDLLSDHVSRVSVKRRKIRWMTDLHMIPLYNKMKPNCFY